MHGHAFELLVWNNILIMGNIDDKINHNFIMITDVQVYNHVLWTRSDELMISNNNISMTTPIKGDQFA